MADDIIPVHIGFAKRYDDNSGSKIAVSYHTYNDYRPNTVEIECIETIHVPVEEIDWLIEVLRRVQAVIDTPPREGEAG